MCYLISAALPLDHKFQKFARKQAQKARTNFLDAAKTALVTPGEQNRPGYELLANTAPWAISQNCDAMSGVIKGGEYKFLNLFEDVSPTMTCSEDTLK